MNLTEIQKNWDLRGNTHHVILLKPLDYQDLTHIDVPMVRFNLDHSHLVSKVGIYSP